MKNKISIIITMTIYMVLFSSCETHELTEPNILVPLTVTEDPSLPSISLNNTLLHSETYGNPNNPMIIVLHGGPGGDYRSLLNCKDFADDGYYVVFYDQRGSGLSQRHNPNTYTVQIYTDDLDAVIEYYRQSAEQKIIFMGHSWGAMLATAYVNQYPDRMSGLVLMEPGGFTWEVTLDYIERSSPLELFGEATNDYLYLDQFITGDDHNTLDYKENLRMAVGFAEGNKTGNEGPYPFWRFGAICANATTKYAEENSFDFTTDLNQYTTKVLFAYSELNEAYGKEHAEQVSSAYPNVQLVKINSTGHEIPYFGWDNYYPLALAYLNEIKNN